MAKFSKPATLEGQFKDLINTMNAQNPYMVVGLVMGLILIAYYFVFLGAKLQEITAVSSEITSTSDSLTTTYNDIQRYSQYRDAEKNLQTRVDELSDKIKSSEDIPQLLEHLTSVAAQQGIIIEQMMPDSSRSKVVLKNKDGKYVATPIIIGAKSSYHNFGKFMSVIERDGGFSGIQDFGIMTNPTDSNQHLIKLVLKVTTFEKLDKNEKPDKPAGKGKNAE